MYQIGRDIERDEYHAHCVCSTAVERIEQLGVGKSVVWLVRRNVKLRGNSMFG
jgi:hypothetical protein